MKMVVSFSTFERSNQVEWVTFESPETGELFRVFPDRFVDLETLDEFCREVESEFE